jgi:hypothetical protein
MSYHDLYFFGPYWFLVSFFIFVLFVFLPLSLLSAQGTPADGVLDDIIHSLDLESLCKFPVRTYSHLHKQDEILFNRTVLLLSIPSVHPFLPGGGGEVKRDAECCCVFLRSDR